MENKQKFTFEVSGLSGLNLLTDKLEKIEIEIYAESLRDAQDKIRDYFFKGYFKADSIKLLKIGF